MKFSDPHPGVEGAGRRDGIPEGRAETDLTDGNVGADMLPLGFSS